MWLTIVRLDGAIERFQRIHNRYENLRSLFWRRPSPGQTAEKDALSFILPSVYKNDSRRVHVICTELDTELGRWFVTRLEQGL
jgi:hypothetical protein